MKPDARIYVAGHTGLVGSAILRKLESLGHSPESLITRTHAELDLADQRATQAFFEQERPEYVFLAAAKAGGIYANNTYPAEFIYENLAIQTNVIHEAWKAGVKRLLFLGSSCIYPRDCPQPIKEEYLLTGPLEPTNRSYAIAKIAGIEMCWSYNRQYGTKFLAAMPTNLYGPGDNYDLETSHVLPALIRKFHEAKIKSTTSRLTPHASRDDSVVVWGTGKPRREFLYSDDAADGCVFLMNLPDEQFASLLTPHSSPPLINIGCGQDQTISELADTVRKVVGYEGDITWDSSKPDGTPRKLLDVTRLGTLGWKPSTGLAEGITKAYEGYLARLANDRRQARVSE
ncbi:MAG: GDP-L-fucose synthase family protein [Acidiferrobacterales bacterium]